MEEASDPTEPMLAASGAGVPGDEGAGMLARIRSAFARGPPKDSLKPYQELIISPKLFKRSLNAVRLAVFVDAVAGTVEQPNFAIMASPGDHPDSFPDTEPFGFSGATYFLPATLLLGCAIASTAIDKLSDAKGRKPCLLACLYPTAVGCVVKYVCRGNFLAYCGVNFLTGLFSASMTVAMAYAGDVMETKREKDAEIGLISGLYLIGGGIGGIIAILMESEGLFAPLLVAAALMAVTAVLSTVLVIEPRDILASRARESEELRLAGNEEDDDDGLPVPVALNWRVFVNIIIGALGDNIGSVGLFPLSVAPLAFQVFYRDFDQQDLEPIMTQVGYKWITVMIMIMAIPGTIFSPPIYNTIGLAGGCILGNIITGIVTIALLYIALAPPTNATFGIFVALLYASFPFTIISQLSTGPMLEAIAPPDKRGFAQGIGVTVMVIGTALAPWLIGMLADAAGTPAAIWTCVGFSFLAAVINAPLLWVKGCNVPPKPRPAGLKPLRGEDRETVEKALRGEWIPAEQLEAINEERVRNGQPYLIIHPRSYEDDKGDLPSLARRAKKDSLYHQSKNKEYLHLVNTADDLASLCDQINTSMKSSDEDERETIKQEVGQWVIDYLEDSGYMPEVYSIFIKQAIMSAFPVAVPNFREEGFTPDNIERSLLRLERVYANLIEMEGFDGTRALTVGKILSRSVPVGPYL